LFSVGDNLSGIFSKFSRKLTSERFKDFHDRFFRDEKVKFFYVDFFSQDVTIFGEERFEGRHRGKGR
jgi:hypothetical protein